MFTATNCLKNAAVFIGRRIIEYVTREAPLHAELPHKFEAARRGGACGLAAAIDYRKKFENIAEAENHLPKLLFFGAERARLMLRLSARKNPAEHRGIITFTVNGVHPHDISAILDAMALDSRGSPLVPSQAMKHLARRPPQGQKLFLL